MPVQLTIPQIEPVLHALNIAGLSVFAPFRVTHPVLLIQIGTQIRTGHVDHGESHCERLLAISVNCYV